MLDEAEEYDDWHGAKIGASETELYVTTANTVDRIKRDLEKGVLDGMPIKAVIFAVLSPQDEMMLWQGGEAASVWNLGHAAAHMAVKSLQEAQEALEEEEGSQEGPYFEIDDEGNVT